MSQVTYRGVKYDTIRPAKRTLLMKVEEVWRGIKYQKEVEVSQK